MNNQKYKRKLKWILILFLVAPLFLSSIGQCQDIRATLRKISEKNRFSFVILGDRTGSTPESWNILDQAINEINMLRPDFVIMIGDLIEKELNSTVSIQDLWSEAIQHIEPLTMPFILVPGNHDIWDQLSYQIWLQTMGKTYHAFNYKGSHFIILNTEENHGSGEQGLGEKQMSFLKEEIQKHHQSQHLFIFLHQPVWLPSEKEKFNWSEIESLLEGTNYSIFAGHLHVLASKQYQGHRYLISGPTGGKMRLTRNPSLGFLQHYTWVTVEDEKSYIAFIEPGNIYSEEIAQNAYKRYLQGLYLLKGNNPY